MFRYPGPVCSIRNDWYNDIDDGTLARHLSPYPGIIGQSDGSIAEDVNAPKTLTSEDILKIAPGAADKAATIASALNRATADAGITTRIGQSMLIAQCAHESGGFVGDEYVESGVESKVVFNAGAHIEDKFKVKAVQTGRLERYLQGHNIATWRLSHDKFLKAKTDYEKTNAGKKFEDLAGDKVWRPVNLTDYLPGDVELPYWKLWYDPSSPHSGRSHNAKVNGNVAEGDGLKYIGRGLIQLTWRSNYRDAGKALNLELEKNPESAAELENAIRIAAWYWKSRGLNKFAKADNDTNFKKVTHGINPGLAGMADRQNYYKKVKSALGVGVF
jgi:predicted chitinase